MIQALDRAGVWSGSSEWCRTSAARFHSGIVRPVESAVKPTRRNTKARSGCGSCGPWYYHRTRVESQRQYLG